MNTYQKNAARLLLTVCVIFLVQACSGTPTKPPKKGTLETNQEVMAFVDSYYANLSAGTAQRASGPPLQMSVRVGPASDPDICTTGELYGPFTVSGDSVTGGSSVTVSQPSIRLANRGELAICMIVTSPVNASLDVETDAVFVEAEECDQAPANISGTWTGSYSCSGSCGAESGSVSLTIVQDDYTATYDDGEAFYEGNVCGNTFKFSGGTDTYDESGTFTLNSNGTGSKTSSYTLTDNSCGGTCSDPVLTRIP